MSYLGENIPKLGFGLMRLPQLEDKSIDIEQTKKMVDMFLERGFTYFDTAYGYNEGESEKAIGKALVERHPRESFYLATKLPAWAGAANAEEAKQMFWTSLERTGAGYFDFYLLHNLGPGRTGKFDEYGIWEYAKELKEKGLVRHIGFSMHDSAENLEKVLKEHPEAEFVQLQINYADWEDRDVQSRLCYEVARKYNKPIIIMEPIKGGTLAKLPESVEKVFKDYSQTDSPSKWALRFAASLEGVITVLSGMSNLEQMEENTGFMSSFKPLDEQEQQVVQAARDAFAAMPHVPCTGCSYCTDGCPMNIPIPDIMNLYNGHLLYNQANRFFYNAKTAGRGKASDCVSCGHCESVCPQQIEISKHLADAAKVFEG